MEIRLLGPVEVAVDDRTVPLGSPRQRAVFAMLALAAPGIVSVDRFVDGLWGEEPPGNPAAALQVFVHGLRKALKTESLDHVVVREHAGYRLAVDPGAVDIGRASTLHQRARDAREEGDLAAAAAALAEARALWRGPALADVRATPFAEPEAVRLDELRLLVEEDLYDAELALGRHHALVDPLSSAVTDHPMRERFWGQLMTALYRSDRQADALATYARARERLADELGIDPGQALQQLELAILRQDPSIAAPAPAAPQLPVVVAPRSPSRVPRPTTPTFGREHLVEQVHLLLRRDDVRAVTLTGPGGSGKSRLAALAALAAEDDFAGGVVHLAMTERTDVDQVLAEVALALTGNDDPAGLDGLDTDALLVLDNLESVDGAAGLVADLVERTAGPTVLSTSRLPLRIRAEHDVAVPPLDVPAADASPAEVLAAPAVAMFLDRARAIAADGDHEQRLAEVAELCRFLDGFPLAIELAAAQVRLLAPGEIRAALDQDLGVLQARGLDVPERQQTLAATIEWSYERLDPDARRIVDRLALFERSFTIEAVEAVCDDVPDVLAALAQVVEARLVRSAESRVEVRFVALGTVRAYARARLAEQTDVAARRDALSDHLRRRVLAWREELDGPTGTAVLGRYDDTAADLDAALDRALAEGATDLAVELASSLTDLWIASGRLTDGLRRTTALLDLPDLTDGDRAVLHLVAGKLAYHLTDWSRAASECRAVLSLTTDERVLADARCHLGAALVVTGSEDEGTALAQQALAAAEALGDYRITVVALSMLAIGCAVRGDVEAERAYYERRLEVVGERGDAARLADTLNTLAEIALDESDPASARAYAGESVAIAGAALPLERRDATISLARAAALDDDAAEAATHLRTALELSDRTGQALAVAQCLRVGGCLAVLSADHVLAVRAFAAAQRVSPSPSGTDDPIEADLAARLGQARDSLGADRAAREWTLGRTLPLASTRAAVDGLVSQGLSER
ncbi:AfsR/SARP family transcriptional regulator [Nocardioides marmoribigeumensis]|uniref:DNA-binding SARP family transcriptional activator/predicted ATPase n=1 Tax=Nocardioides marmoribigeumensis TaxID=433649 RepID=A0ABU2BRS8_9ACTN|nr:BTAD domain-containing putative transcriptional regulator [Nocardioides marmoribigeumensis]MDR7361335.1 DNA-binding SARP family transcriptional activator/predicted ATPase [Nocardioides marmoribigeumensis]